MKILNFSKYIRNRILQSFLIYLFLAFTFALNFYGMKEDIKGIETFFDSIYFSFVTITTLGYGDIAPISNLAKFSVMMESVAGVVLLGFFLIVVSSEVAYTKERKRIQSVKLHFEEQYKIWQKNMIVSLVRLTDEPIDYLDYEIINKLLDTEELKNYFKKGDMKWYAVINNLSCNNLYTKELLYELDFLQRIIENFVITVPLDNLNVIRILNINIHAIDRIKQYNLDADDEKMLFSDRLWEILVLWNKSRDETNLLNTIKSV